MHDPLPGKLSAAIEALATDMLTELSPLTDRGGVDDFVDMLTSNPWAAAGITIKNLNLLQQLGSWQHENPEIQSFIEANWAQMDGSYKLAISEMATATALGWSSTEFALREPQDNRWMIQSLTLIPHNSHSFEGRLGRIESVRYRAVAAEALIPYERVVHIVNKRDIAALTQSPPYGVADCRLAIAAHKAWRIILSEMLVAGQRQATPLLVGYADRDSFVELLDSGGNPLTNQAGQPVRIPASQKLLQDMQSLNANGGVIAMGITDPTRSRIEALNQQTDGRFFLDMLQLLQRTMLLSFMVPFTTVEEGMRGLGNAGLAQTQLKNMQSMLAQVVEQIEEELTEKVIRPLIEWNFGAQETYGAWASPEEDEGQAIELLSALNSAFSAGIYSTADLQAINRHRQLAGIPEIKEVAASFNRPSRYWKDVA